MQSARPLAHGNTLEQPAGLGIDHEHIAVGFIGDIQPDTRRGRRRCGRLRGLAGRSPPQALIAKAPITTAARSELIAQTSLRTLSRRLSSAHVPDLARCSLTYGRGAPPPRLGPRRLAARVSTTLGPHRHPDLAPFTPDSRFTPDLVCCSLTYRRGPHPHVARRPRRGFRYLDLKRSSPAGPVSASMVRSSRTPRACRRRRR